MDKLAKKIQENSTSFKDLKGLLEFLQKNDQAFAKNHTQIDQVLESLNTKECSMGYIFLMSIKAQLDMEDATLFIQQCQRLFLNFNRDQAQMVEARFYFIAARFASTLTQLNMPMAGILPLKNAALNGSPDENTLSPIHCEFLQLCILARCYNAALPVLRSTILGISKGGHHSFYLRFHYYGGIVFLALKQYENALLFFDRVVSARAVVLSAIMFEAYKKYILTSLLVEGKVSGGKSSMVQRHLKALTQPYHEFATAYSTKSVVDINKCLEKNAEHFLKDRNLGLVKKCVSSLYNTNIKSYTKTYLTLSLKGISEGAKIEKVEEVETRLIRMIEAGDIYASVNEKDGIVSFSEASEKYDTSSTQNQLDNNLKSLIRLGDIIKYNDDKNALNFNYIQRTQLQEHRFEEHDDIGGMGMGMMGMGGMFRG